jgi:hypothetical protein
MHATQCPRAETMIEIEQIRVSRETSGGNLKISTPRTYFYISPNNLNNLILGLKKHFEHHKYLNGASGEELALIGKNKPKRDAIAEIEYQLERKEFNGLLLKPSQLLSRLPYQSQSRNRNGKQNIADKRWKTDNQKVEALKFYYHTEAEFIKTFLVPSELDSLPKGSFAISPCHIEPALEDRDEDSWTPVKICRDLSIMNKGFDKIKACELKGAHAINQEQALIALEYLKTLNWDEMSVTRKVMYYILWFRTKNNFYSKFDITDIGLGL